jgi:sulfur-oxidizing protein SoxY
MTRPWVLAAMLGALACAGAPAISAQDEDAELREARWNDLKQSVFGDRDLRDGSAILSLDAPARALDASLVPIGIDLLGREPIKGLYLIIDNNPSPLAAHFTFGPRADPRTLRLRVRVDQYTDIRAIAEMQDGTLYAVSRFVKASGGCSAPAGTSPADALKDLGLMKLKVQGEVRPGDPVQAQLMIRHPNFNGMQMDQITRYYTPAHFIRSIDVTYDGGQVFRLDSDISLSTDPVITFGFVPEAKGQLRVVVHDTKDQTFDRTFDVPAG